MQVRADLDRHPVFHAELEKKVAAEDVAAASSASAGWVAPPWQEWDAMAAAHEEEQEEAVCHHRYRQPAPTVQAQYLAGFLALVCQDGSPGLRAHSAAVAQHRGLSDPRAAGPAAALAAEEHPEEGGSSSPAAGLSARALAA